MSVLGVGFKCLLGTSPDDRGYFPRQSIHTPALVFQIGGGAKIRPLYVIGGSARISVSLIAKGAKGVSTQTSSLILAVSYFKDMLITLVNETHMLGGFLTDD